MADVPLDLTAYSNVLKDVYEVGIAEAVNHCHYFMDRIKKNVEDIDFVGKQAIIPVEYADNEGFAFRSIATEPALPVAGVPKWTQSKTPIRGCYGVLRIDSPTIKASRSDKGAFAKGLDTLVRNLKNGIARDMNRILLGDGYGMLSLGGTTSGSTTINLATFPGVKWIRNGMLVDIRTLTTGAIVTNGSAALVSARSASGNTFVVPAAVSCTVLEGIFRAGALGVEMMGIKGIINNADPAGGDLQGIDRMSYPEWQSYVFDNPLGTGGTDRAISLRLMDQACDKAELENGGHVSIIVTTPAIRRNYTNLLIADRRFVKDLKLDGGHTGVAYSHSHEIPIMADPDCYKGHMYFVDESTLNRYVMADWGWLDEGTGILKWNSGYASFTAVMEAYMEIGCSNPSRNTVIKDIDETEV